jgi:tetratricopeptide (TPR) repeat protein
MFKKIRLLFLLFCSVLSVTFFIEFCSPKKNNIANTSNIYIGSANCKTCHEKEFNEWKMSDHFKAMQAVNDSSVAGNFNNQIFIADGVKNVFFRKDGKYFINTQSEDGSNRNYEVKYTFGYFPLQQYLIEFPNGKMQAARTSWDAKNKKWFHQYPGQKIQPHDWLHWTGNAQNWNTMCAVCHSTKLQKNYNTEKDGYTTTYSEINVSCESCHGAGKLHADYINGDYKKGNKIAGSYLKLVAADEQVAQINTCAPCHARASAISSNSFNAEMQSNELLDYLIPESPTTENYHADGQANNEDYIYTSFAESKMFYRGVKCSNCHNPHSGKLIRTGNLVCMQCHTPEHNTSTHTFHATGSAGAECKNCHMPGKAYMGNDMRFDHTFRVPRPDLSVKYNMPNACNNCHTNKSAQWASDAVIKWYGKNRKYSFAEDLIPGSKTGTPAETHLLQLMADTSVPAIVQSAAVKYLGEHHSNSSVNSLLQSLHHTDAIVRYQTLNSLTNFPSSVWMNAAGNLLSDKVKAVRIAAAQLYCVLPDNEIPSSFFAAYTSAKKELENYLSYQTDFAVGNVMLGDYFLKTKNYTGAEKFYKKALQKDSNMNYVRLNLSSVYNINSKNKDALNILLEAQKIDPKNDRIYYNLALLYVEMGNKQEAAVAFEKAITLHTVNPRLFYNYGLLLDGMGNIKKSIAVFRQGLIIEPQNPDLNYVLALAYIKNGQQAKAKVVSIFLQKTYPDNPDYQQLLQTLQ